MYQTMQRQMDKLRQKVAILGAEVEESLHNAIKALEAKDARLAKQVIEADDRIDALEIDIEEDCLQTLALYQPVADNLRYVVAVLKVNQDLERIGDLCVNIAEQVQMLCTQTPADIPGLKLAQMGVMAKSMLRKSLDALTTLNITLAKEVRASDPTLDELHRNSYTVVEQVLHQDQNLTDWALSCLSISRYLERIGDQSVNIAEDVIYMVEGEIYRHRSKREKAGKL